MRGGEFPLEQALPDGIFVGILPDAGSDGGIVFGQASKLVPCMNTASGCLKASGTLQELKGEWLTPRRGVPTSTN